MDSPRSSTAFANRDFRLLFGGSSISMVGDQFTLIALPWLVLQLTGNPAQLGLVLAAMALPRAGAGLSLTAVALLCLTSPSLRAIQLQTAPA